MNKRFVVVLLLVCILLTACGKNTNETTAAETTEATTETMAVIETKPGTGINPFENPDKAETTEPEEETTAPAEDNEEETTDSGEPSEKNDDTTEPTTSQNEVQNTQAKEPSDYEKYVNMSGDQQAAFIESFGSPEAFFAWLNNAKAEYTVNNPGVIVDDGVIDLEEITESKQ